MRKQFKRFGLNISTIEVSDGITVVDVIELLDDEGTTEKDKRDLFFDLKVCLQKYSCGLSKRDNL